MPPAVLIAPSDIVSIPTLLGMAPKDVAVKVTEAAHLARTHLVTLAQSQLATSARDYVKGIQPVTVTEGKQDTTAVIQLTGALPNMVEHGRRQWDLRDTVLSPANKKRKKSKQGFFYAYIPFRHMGPDANGKNAPAVGSAYSKAGQSGASRAHRGDLDQRQARAMGRAVWRAAQKLGETKSAPGKGVKNAKGLPEGVGGAGLLRPRHLTDIYAGMRKETKVYAKAKQSQFVSFRTISTNPASFRSDAIGGSLQLNWTHPGITARRLFPQTMRYLEDLHTAGAIGV